MQYVAKKNCPPNRQYGVITKKSQYKTYRCENLKFQFIIALYIFVCLCFLSFFLLAIFLFLSHSFLLFSFLPRPSFLSLNNSFFRHAR